MYYIICLNVFQYLILNCIFVFPRRELETLRGHSGGNQQKNDHLTVQWLASSVAEVRGEVTELAAACNKSEELASRQAMGAQLELLRGDVSTMRKDLDQVRADKESATARVATLEQEIEATKAQCQNSALILLQLEEKVWSFKYFKSKLSIKCEKPFLSVEFTFAMHSSLV